MKRTIAVLVLAAVLYAPRPAHAWTYGGMPTTNSESWSLLMGYVREQFWNAMGGIGFAGLEDMIEDKSGWVGAPHSVEAPPPSDT